MAEALKPYLELRSLTKDFPGVRALDGVSLTLGRGEIHAICGENGAGKSTLVKILSGYFPAGSYEGEIRIDGEVQRFRTLRAAEEKGIALIAQELALVPELSVAENLVLGREPQRGGVIQWHAVREYARSALARVGLDLDPDRPVRELGIGQQQMIEIAKALAKSASILVLDEPTAALTESDARRLLAFLKELRARGVALIYISHRLEEVFEIADRITVLRDGTSVSTHAASEVTADVVISKMVGREVKNLYPRGASAPGRTILEVKGWRVEDPANPGRFVVKDIEFVVRAGEIFGVAGLMGAGRTALLSSLFGAARSSTSGTLSIEGGPARRPFRNPEEAIAAGLALVSEDRKRYGLVLEASVEANLTLVTLERFAKGGLVDHVREEGEAAELVKSLRIKTPGLLARVRELSGGNQQKVVLGKWLMAHPKVLFLDEPTRGIDVGAKLEIYNLMNLLSSQGVGVVLVSSDLPELLGMSHRVLVLSQGRSTALLEGNAATPEQVMTAATAKIRDEGVPA
jgi:D-xylose transport system ATP-binding protein